MTLSLGDNRVAASRLSGFAVIPGASAPPAADLLEARASA